MDKKERVLKFIKLIPLCIWAAILIAAVVGKFAGESEFSAESLADLAPENALLAALAVILFHALKTVSVMFPLMVIQLATGLVFPKAAAIIINLVGTAVCFIIGYGLGVYAGTGVVGKLVDNSPRLARLLECQNKNTLFFCFFLRSIFITPMDVVSMYFGATRAEFGKYMLGSMLGMLPCVVLTTIMGKNMLDPTSPEFLGSFAVIILFSAVSLVWYVLYKKKNGL